MRKKVSYNDKINKIMEEYGISYSAARYAYQRMKNGLPYRPVPRTRPATREEILLNCTWDGLELWSKRDFRPKKQCKIYNPNGHYHWYYTLSIKGRNKLVSVAYVCYLMNHEELDYIDSNYVVDHIDNNPDNNFIWNLQLLTIAENIRKEGSHNQYTKQRV